MFDRAAIIDALDAAQRHIMTPKAGQKGDSSEKKHVTSGTCPFSLNLSCPARIRIAAGWADHLLSTLRRWKIPACVRDEK
jgi:hypothetical protein